MSSRLCSLTFIVALPCLLAAAVHFDIDATKFNESELAISSFVEPNVNRADDGGLYAVCVQNRAFQEQNTYLSIPGWTKIGSPALYIDPDTHLGAIGHSLEIYISANSSKLPGERAGIANSGWYGIPILNQPYNLSFWAKRDQVSKLTGDIQLSLVSLTNNVTYAAVNFSASNVMTEWKQFSAVLHPNAEAPDSNNVLTLTLEVSSNHAQHAWFNLISLFPPTYKNRTNGLRIDLAEAIADLKPKYARIPGGSNMQGSIPQRFNWTLSLGPLQDRPGRAGYWVGYQTEGLGLKELLDMIEDFGATPVLGIYDGYAASDESIPNTSQLDKYIQSAVDELDFILAGSKTNKWGHLRAELGHLEPYELHYVEIGNEDFTSTTYDYRWQRFYDALKKAYPDVNYVASAHLGGVHLPAVDVHDFSGPDFFYDAFTRYDTWPRNGTKIFELENAVINTNSDNPFGTPDTRLKTPTLQGSIAESIFLMGMQRNGDLIVSSSYAPYLANNYSLQWTPDFINFNVSHVSLSTRRVYLPYHIHRIFSHARADRTHAVTTDASFGPLYWVASSANDSSTFFLHLANINEASVSVTGTIQGALNRNATSTRRLNAEATLVSAPLGQPYNVTNSLDTPDVVVPITAPITIQPDGKDLAFSFTAPGWSYGVYTFTV
ncbi:glycoside hydrolase superfamily [Irpex rosettiformis]|uniref:Glycoside hydrolase superfamily n=1 Tax=Irpex rosettiformis TaxID=378272 RepID=A0ACB8U830_9APHY|nr:glycoside hydrolase superfamily [Irpex rosettiformis]